MEKMKTKRAPLRTAFTKTLNSLKEEVEKEDADLQNVSTLLEQMEEKFLRLRKIDEEILEFLLDSQASEEEYTKEFDACEAYNEKFIILKQKVKKIEASANASTTLSAEEKNMEYYQPMIAPSTTFKLPKINMIDFDGDPRHWLNFWNTFKKIHEDPTIDSHSKFVYLIQATTPKSKAREIVQSFPTTEENYPKVIEHLRNRFGREDILIQLYVRDLLNIVLSNNGKKNINLSFLYDSLEAKLRSLESLGVTQDKYASILFPLVESSLPPDILKIWEREREKTTQGKTDLECILLFLKNEVLADERLMFARFAIDKPKKYAKTDISDEPNIATCNDLYMGSKLKERGSVRKIEEMCIFCDKPHLTEKCFKANTLSYEDRKNLILKKGACFVCLKRNHVVRNCTSRVKCILCGKRHLAVMCPQISPCSKVNSETVVEDSKNNANILTSQVSHSDVLLQTLVIKIKNGSREISIRGILDTGSERTYLTDDVINFLKLENCGEVKLIHKLFGGVETSEKLHYKYTVNLTSIDGNYNCYVNCLNESVICSDVKKIPKGPWLNELKKNNIQVTDVEGSFPKIGSEIKLLIGSDIAGKLFTGNVKCLQSGPVAMQTHLGWVLMGKIPSNKAETNDSFSCVNLFLSEKSVENFWKLDVIGINDPAESKTKVEIHEETMQYFKENLNVDSDGRYEVALPFILDSSRLKGNKEIAEKRLASMRKKLIDTNKIVVYEEVFDTWLKEQIIEEVREEKICQEHYLPHRPVFKEASETTKVRPVFDASAHAKGCLSLNDCLEKGPNLIEMVPSLLSRFRKYSIGITSDIEKAFLQIGVREKDRDYLRFLWTNSKGENKIFRHRRVVFGLNCSPFLLAATLNSHLDKAPDHFSVTANTLRESLYVDNCLVSFKDTEEASKFVLESKMLLSSAKFNLREWKSNCKIELIPNSRSSISTSVLGLSWELENDTLSCRVESQGEGEIVATKRTLLSCTQKLFDPLGFSSPVTLIPKLILQECWRLNLNWDQSLTENLEQKFLKWKKDMHLLNDLKIPRWLNIGKTNDEKISLHVFCDASRVAYSTCIFLRVETKNNVCVNFVQARARVSPLKNITIPRLELLGCLIGARLGRTVIVDLKIPELRIYYWTDSSTALCWIQRNMRWGTFVWNRVQEIRSLSEGGEWRHIPSDVNPADLPSRGCHVKEFLKSKWWEGPVWLKESESSWPVNTFKPDEEIINTEKRKSVLTALDKASKPDDWYYRYFSSYIKIVRLIAWILRFVNNSRKIKLCLEKDLSFVELETAEKTLFILIQKDLFDKYEKDEFKNLRAFIDQFGILRVKTQVMYRKDTYDFKYPVLLPSDHPVVHLLISWKHQELLHAGVSLLMSNLRENFWIIKARKTIRTVVQRCVRCKRFSAKRTETEPISLPAERVQDTATFQVTGVDLAGPLYLKGGHKAWIVLHTCAVYRAVHLELTTSLSTESFLQSFRRFIARRGRPLVVYSDNGTNFLGAHNAFTNIDWAQIAKVSAVQKIQWKFSPPTAAWWGGWWERLIQLVKRILRKVVGKAILSYEELITVLCDCEQVINTRPLTHITEEVDDLSPLTPSHFLQELPSDVTDIDNIDKVGLNNRLKYVQEVREHLRT